MSKFKVFLYDLFEFYLRLPFFTFSVIFVLLGIFGLIFNTNLVIGSFAFAIVMFIGQIVANKSSF